MKLKFKISFILAVVIALFIIFVYYIEQTYILPVYREIEEAEAYQDFAICSNAIHSEMNHLKLLATGWSTWDDTYNFILDKYRKHFLKSDLNKAALKISKLDIILFYDINQKLVWGKVEGSSFPQQEALKNANSFLREEDFLFQKKQDTDTGYCGIISTPFGLSFLAVNPIIQSSQKGKCVGTLVMGRYFNKNYSNRIIARTGTSFKLFSLKNPKEKNTVSRKLINELHKKNTIITLGPKGEYFYAYSLLKNIQNQNTLILSVETKRSIYNKAHKTLNFALYLIMAVGIIILIVLAELLHHVIIKPIAKLTEHTKKIKQSRYKLTEQIDIPKRKDEIGILSKEFTSMAKETRQLIEKMEDTIQARVKDIRFAREDTILRLARAVDSKDCETGKHIFRLKSIVRFVASKLNMSRSECDNISLASSLHDIGKIGIADKILKKIEKLDSAEYEVMKNHTKIGAKILSGSNSKLLETAKEIALHHHERWDGTGYPYGLAKEDIPLSARITNIADVFDALRSKRVYKDAWSLNEVIEHLNKNKGFIFDPNLVEIFIDNIEEIEELRNQYKD